MPEEIRIVSEYEVYLFGEGRWLRAWEKMGWVTQVRRPTSDQILRKLGRGD